jgi:hypothetical protein
MPGDSKERVNRRTMVTFTQAAERLVTEGIVRRMTPEGLRKLARDPHSGWPISPEDYGTVAGARTLPYEVLAAWMPTRRRVRRTPASKPEKTD